MTEQIIIKNLIVAAIEGKQGCKTTELIVIPSLIQAVVEMRGDFMALIQELIDEGRIIEIEYTVPNLDWRIKSFLLPAGSTIHWPKG
jgi:hypothetical protein